MANIRYNLKNPKSNKPTSIFLIYQIKPTGHNSRLKFYTGHKIIPKHWNKSKMRPINHLDYRPLTNLLDTMRDYLNQTIIEMRIMHDLITPDSLKKKLSTRFQIRQKESKKYHFTKYINEFIDNRKKLPQYKNNTIRAYNLFLSNIKKFDKHTNQTTLIDDLNIDWYESFCAWLYSRGSSANYVNAQTKKLKLFWKNAFLDGVTKNNDYQNEKIRAPARYTLKCYLTDSEIIKIYKYNYPNKYLRNAANLFTIACVTGLRFSDLIGLDYDRDKIIIDSKIYLRVRTQKTDVDVIIPYNPLIDDIIGKYDIIPISNQKLNNYIKICAKLSGITTETLHISYPSGIIKKQYLPKYKIISTHTARRSFVTNMYIKGVPSQYIMRITGHKSEKTFMQYLSLSNIDTAILLSKKIDNK